MATFVSMSEVYKLFRVLLVLDTNSPGNELGAFACFDRNDFCQTTEYSRVRMVHGTNDPGGLKSCLEIT